MFTTYIPYWTLRLEKNFQIMFESYIQYLLYLLNLQTVEENSDNFSTYIPFLLSLLNLKIEEDDPDPVYNLHST